MRRLRLTQAKKSGHAAASSHYERLVLTLQLNTFRLRSIGVPDESRIFVTNKSREAKLDPICAAQK